MAKITKYRKVRNPVTGKIETKAYQAEGPSSQTASFLSRIQDIKTASTGNNTKLINGKLLQTNQLQTLKDIAEAKKLGADPRTFRTKSEDYSGRTAEEAAFEGPAMVQNGLILFGDDSAKAGEAARAEIKVRPGLQAIKQNRKSLVQLEAKTISRKTGRRALLTSPAGGSGFYGGYFDGK